MSRVIKAFPVLLVLLWCTGAQAQTADQIRQYRQLTPEQQQALRQAVQEPGDSRVEEEPLTEPQVVVPTAPREEQGPSAIERRYAGRTNIAHLRQAQAEKAITQELKQFGYDLFEGVPTTFAPATDIPVPPSYVIGPGDTIQLQLYGRENAEYGLVVTREGLLHFPQIGAIPVAGMSFDQLRKNLEQRVAEQMIGTKASVTMGALRSIRVFVLGDVTRSGSYTVSALSTMTNALFVSGGIRPIGSLRNVQLKRKGRVVARLDLYDLLLRGDTSRDARLQPGDVIFVPPIGQTAGIAGEVRRPAIYELRGEKTVGQLVEIAGGLLPTAMPQLAQLERLDTQGNLTLLDLDLSQEPQSASALSDGDVLRVYSNLERMDNIVLLAGHVKRPGGVAWRDDLRLADLIPNPDHLLTQPDLDYVVIRREEHPLAKISVFSVRLSQAWANPESDANVLLERRDQIFVFPLVTPAAHSIIPANAAVESNSAPFAKTGQARNEPSSAPFVKGGRREAAGGFIPSTKSATRFSYVNRQQLLEPVLDELRTQAGISEPTRIVTVNGLIREPGNYPLEPGMRVTDLLRAGGRLAEAAYTLTAEITRYDVIDGEKREIAHIPVDLAAALQGDAAEDLPLQPYDTLNIKRLPQWSEQFLVEVRGEVRFPGTYPIKRGERLSDLLERAGGLTDQAFPEGSVFTREELRLKEQERIDRLARQLETDLAAAALQRAQEDPQQQQALATAEALLPQLRATRAVGRLVIDLPDLLERGEQSEYDVVLKGGDTLIIPPRTQEVTVIGEVQQPTSHLAETGKSASDYIKRSGGLTYKADDDRTYVVRANGLVEPATSGWWIFRVSRTVRPGDTIVVPLDVERMRPLAFWASVTQIIYQLALTAAAANAVGVF